MAHYRSRRRARFNRAKTFSPIIGFLLIASFGILFAGCSKSTSKQDEYVFTEEDAAKFHQLAQQMNDSGTTMTTSASTVAMTGSGAQSSGPFLAPLNTASGAQVDGVPILDLSMVKTYNSIRTGGATGGSNMFRVTNEFLNVRSEPKTGASTVSTLNRGDLVEVISFVDGRWAKVKIGGGIGYVSNDYIAKLTTEDQLAQEQQKYAGQYFVNYKFVNMRKDKSAQSDKVGEIPGFAIVTPKSVEKEWMLVNYGGVDGYVSSSYMKAFLPTFLVRQNSFNLPIIQYRLGQTDILKNMPAQLDALKKAGANFVTLREFSDLLLRQEQRDARLAPHSVSIIVTNVDSSNMKTVSDILSAAGVKATLFIETKDVGLAGITEKSMLTLMANGFDLQSGGHTGDDLRALTNSQIDLELKQSRELLEQYTKRSVFAVAYPQGGANDRVMQLAAADGYFFGVTGDSNKTFTREQLLGIPSIVVFPTTSSEEIVRAVSGS